MQGAQATTNLWKPAMERGFRRAGDETYVGRLGEAPCTIAVVPVIYGYFGVLVTAKIVSPLRGTLFWRRGRVASSMFSGGVAPDADDPTFGAEYRVLSDGPEMVALGSDLPLRTRAAHRVPAGATARAFDPADGGGAPRRRNAGAPRCADRDLEPDTALTPEGARGSEKKNMRRQALREPALALARSPRRVQCPLSLPFFPSLPTPCAFSPSV